MGFICKAIWWGLIAVVANTVLKLYLSLDLNKRQFNHSPGRCRYVAGVTDGSEDIELLPDGTAIISSGLRYTPTSELKGVVGKIFMYEFPKNEEEGKQKPQATELKIITKTLDLKSFNPHGLSIFTDNKGQIFVYVINHAPDGDAIERFLFEKAKKTLTHTKTIKHPFITTANNLVVIALDKFYVTNDRYFTNDILFKFEVGTGASLGNIVYYDGTDAFVVAQFLSSPNGINTDKARKQLYVSLIWSKSIRIYDIQKDNNITFKRDIKTHTATDNLFVDPENGDIWSGAHPIFWDVIKHLENPKTVSAPSQVVRIRLPQKEGESDYISEPYSNDGSVLSGTSAAARYKDHLLIGTVYHKLLLCDILAQELI